MSKLEFLIETLCGVIIVFHLLALIPLIYIFVVLALSF